MEEQPNEAPQNKVDKIGIVASSLCAAHCAICALLPAVFAVIGLDLLLSHEAEWALTIFAIGFAVGALALGWRNHRSKLVGSLLALGIVSLITSRVLEMNSSHHDHDDHHAHHTDNHEEHKDHHKEDHHKEDHHASEHSNHEHDQHKDAHGHEEAHGHGDSHGDSHEEHDEGEFAHALGASVGVLGGLLLLVGHVFNIRFSSQTRKECCD